MFRWLTLLLLATGPVAAVAEQPARAEVPITGGLGVTFGASIAEEKLGYEIAIEDRFPLPDNRPVTLSPTVPGAARPWRFLHQAVLPRPFRALQSATHVMLDREQRPLRVIAHIAYTGCGEDFAWLRTTLVRKYGVLTSPELPPPDGFDEALRIVSAGKQIDVRCGPELVLEFGDFQALARWQRQQKKAATLYERDQASVAKRKLVLEQRRARRYADSFTLGDQYRLSGAFGITFGEPFARNSTRQFPADRPFIAVLPGLPAGFEDGELRLELAPDRSPIVIRGRFPSLSFEEITDALKAKYGSPVKASDRHVIHKLSGKRAIVKRLAGGTVELAFIDIQAQEDQKQRLWRQESEGL